jgi:hypothetical protein
MLIPVTYSSIDISFNRYPSHLQVAKDKKQALHLHHYNLDKGIHPTVSTRPCTYGQHKMVVYRMVPVLLNQQFSNQKTVDFNTPFVQLICDF